jgi:hypothetical protein
LRARLATAGSILFTQIWRRKVTPAGRSYWAHTASARLTSGSASGSWLTPTAATAGTNRGSSAGHDLRNQSRLAGWPTPNAREREETPEQWEERNERQTTANPLLHERQCQLNTVAQFAGWPTPNAGPQNDNDSTWEARREATRIRNGNGNGFGLTLGQMTTSQLSGWPTPTTVETTSSHAQTGRETAGPSRGGPSFGLQDIAQRVLEPSPWPTPTVPNGGRSVSPEAMDATGLTPEGVKHTASLEHVVKFSHWPTPRVNDNVQTDLAAIAETGSSWQGQHRGATVATMAQLVTPPSASGSVAVTIPTAATDSTASIPLAADPSATPGPTTTAGWPTPTSHDSDRGGLASRAMGEGRHGSNLQDFAMLTERPAGWPTPGAQEGNGTMRPSRAATGRTTGYLAEVADLASWPTPTGTDAESSGSTQPRTATHHPGTTLTEASRLTSWATPSARDYKDSGGMATEATNPDGSERTRLDQLGRQVHLTEASWVTPGAHDVGTPNEGRLKQDGQTRDPQCGGNYRMDLHDQVGLTHEILGPTAAGSPAATAGVGQLNPGFSLWLMGYPAAWLSCGAQAMRSYRKRPQPLSLPTLPLIAETEADASSS